jgi:hypothetical protein
MRIVKWLCLVALLLPAAARAQAVAPQDAAQYVGQTATVCGVVASARYALRSRSRPTFRNLDQPYPHQVFTVVIFGDERPKFGAPEVTFIRKRVCATGRIELYRGQAEMILNAPADLVPEDQSRTIPVGPPSTMAPAVSE